ncbi:glutamate dehydrogenase [Corallibacter vietnamensis]|uniref:Glutamate dehydrogenase n=1 Tax=Corallibacter vietnamensis TaxID=904130 RepID=A0ABP7GTV5_9FLAO
MFNYKPLQLIVFLLIGVYSGFSQLGFSHEIGAIVGPVQFRSDFGERANDRNNFGNSGFGIGIVHYINFSYRADCNCYSTDTYFNDHFKLRSELSYNKTKLEHYGEWVAPDKTSTNADKLRAHTGEANNFDIGMQLEYFPFSIRSFQAFSYRIAPFVSLGVHYTSYNPKAYTSYGNSNINNANNFYSYWDPGSINPDSGNTWSLVTSIGARYKLTPLSDLMLDLRWQYYGSDWIDGFDHQLPSNKHNDWLVWLNFGYIYYLD